MTCHSKMFSASKWDIQRHLCALVRKKVGQEILKQSSLLLKAFISNMTGCLDLLVTKKLMFNLSY